MSEAFQILAPDGKLLCPDLVPDDATLERLYRAMLRARTFDERGAVLAKQGRFGAFPFFSGQEAAEVGPVLALEPRDWLLPTYRGTGAAITFGLPMHKAIAWIRNEPLAFDMNHGVNVLPFYIPIATQLPHAAGLALAGKLQHKDWVVLAFIGDGGTSEGDFHVGVNLAGVFDAPCVFVIENNGWAISVPTHKQTKAKTLVSRAEGYGIPGVRVDGNDVLAMHHVAREAVSRARAGDGPTLIEAITYRVNPHTSSDDDKRYRTDVEAKLWRDERDPLKRLYNFMLERELWDETREREYVAQVETEILQELEIVESQSEPDPEFILEHVFATPTPELEAQRLELRALWNAREARA
jgi:pyruvate dehydrogenase E1 component alpha subunit